MALGKIKADTLEHSTAGSIATNFVVEGSAKAFANNTADGTTISKSFNVSSIDDRATGQVDVNLTNSMSDATYAINLTVQNENGNCVFVLASTSPTTTAQYGTGAANTSVTYQDYPVGSMILGDLA
jgi:hypothetical protein